MYWHNSNMMDTHVIRVDALREKFGDRVKEKVSLAPYTSARVGGEADYLIVAHSASELAEIVTFLWQQQWPYLILGGGSNVLVSDKGVRGVTILNRARALRIESGSPPRVWAESGVGLSSLANRCAARGLSGLEWAATVPGTLGGAVYGNAGAFDGDMAGSLSWAEILTEAGQEHWPVERMGYGYRTSALKRGEVKGIVLSAEMILKPAAKDEVRAKIANFVQHRKQTQPPGASMGSMFKNPPGDFAGRLIEAAGLKGTRIGSAEISRVHANFFINHGAARAGDIRDLLILAQKTVKEKFGIELEPEIELIGEW